MGTPENPLGSVPMDSKRWQKSEEEQAEARMLREPLKPIEDLRRAEKVVFATALAILKQHLDGVLTTQETWDALAIRCGLVRGE